MLFYDFCNQLTPIHLNIRNLVKLISKKLTCLLNAKNALKIGHFSVSSSEMVSMCNLFSLIIKLLIFQTELLEDLTFLEWTESWTAVDRNLSRGIVDQISGSNPRKVFITTTYKLCVVTQYVAM